MSREAAAKIVSVLHEAGHVAYFAGGCVRDHLLGVEPQDYDVATNAPPEAVLRLFRSARLVGEAFGVVRVRLMHCDTEVATFRVEWGYSDGRRPDHVQFTDSQHDARRRDFTINGLFEDPLRNEIIDYVGGRADLDAKLVRAIGDPAERFGEDYLRMLRAVRFTARLGFELEAITAAAIPPLASRLEQISRERIGAEVQMMLTAPAAGQRHRAAAMIQALHLDAPTLREPHRDCELPIVASLPDTATYPTVLAAWLVDRGGDVARWRAALCLSNDHRDALVMTLTLAERAASWPTMPVAKQKRWLAHPLRPQAMMLLRGDFPAMIEREAVPLLAAPEGVAPPPFITGDDLVALGCKPGPAFGRWLVEVYDEQLENRVTTRDEALRWVRQRMNR